MDIMKLPNCSSNTVQMLTQWTRGSSLHFMRRHQKTELKSVLCYWHTVVIQTLLIVTRRLPAMLRI